MAGTVFRCDLATGASAADPFIARRNVIMGKQDKAGRLSVYGDTGKRRTQEGAQAWIHDTVASLTQPARTLLRA